MKLDDQGSIVLFTPETDEEKQFLNEEVVSESWQWLGASLACDHRFAYDLAAGCVMAGFEVRS